MTRYTRKITQEQYDRAMLNKGLLTKEDESDVFSIAEICGYGVYMPLVIENNGEYYVTFMLGSSCD